MEEKRIEEELFEEELTEEERRKEEEFDKILTVAFAEYARRSVREPDHALADFSEIAPLLDKYGFVTYSTERKSFVVIENKEFAGLVVKMYLYISKSVTDDTAVKNWNAMLDYLEDVTRKYDCCVQIAQKTSIDFPMAVVNFGKTVDPYFKTREQ